MKINKYKIFTNQSKISNDTLDILRKKLDKAGFIEDDDCNIAIAIGGDGTFLRMVKETCFNGDLLYVGINTGTLGFAQEVNIDGIDEFISSLLNNNYKVDYIGVQETKIKTMNNDFIYNSLNEIVVRDKNLNSLSLDIFIDNVLLEEYVGDGMLIATSFGSTAYNISFGGSIVYNTFHTLQLTPIAPLNNKSYRNLLNSVIIPENKVIKIIPKNKELLVSIDGDNKNINDVCLIETFIKRKRIKCYRNNHYDFSKKINEKFLR